MAIDFPSSPSNGATYTYNGVTYVYNSATDQWIVQGTGSSELYVLKTGDTMTGSLTTVGYSGTTGTFSGNVSTKDLTSADATVDTLTSNGLVSAAAWAGTLASSGAGPVIESTDNGEDDDGYIAFADGTLICWNRECAGTSVAGTGVFNADWTFPKAFTVVPAIIHSVECIDSTQFYFGRSMVKDIEKTKATFYGKKDQTDGTIWIHAIAIGRWKA